MNIVVLIIGDILLTVLTTDNITIEDAGFSLMPFFIELQLVSLQQGQYVYNVISTSNVTELDNNTTLCDMSPYWGFKLVCLSSPSHELYFIFYVNYTDDYDPVWTQNLTFSAPEFTPIFTTIVILSQIHGLYTDQDCAMPNRLASYSIQGGNTDAAFRMQSTSGEIIVNRLISYQKGETKFELIVSITTYSNSDSPGSQSSAAVVINIIDIDDNDPIFDNPQYTLHVPEEDFTVLNVSHWTIPPVFAFDPDTGINDSITYSINGIVDTVGINNETGQVWVTRVMDREVEPFTNVNIKANQVHNSWRSAVATILVVVDDINDNRPKFLINNPTVVIIPEHSALGSSVVRVLALDADEGDNALFNYTIKPDESFFDIHTDMLVSPQYGTVTVANSSALDRETISSLNITVYTEEFTPQQGGDCSTGMCNITITILLTDINDNSPVFDNTSYSLTVRNNIKGVFLVAITASDADEGENADLRYKCLPSYALGSDGCSVITVEDITGEISLSQPLDSLQVYFASIAACDSPTDVSQIISLHPDLQLNVTSYNFTVHENLPAGTHVGDILITIPAVNRIVVIFAPMTSDKLAGEKKRIERELLRILGVDVTIENIRQHSAESSAIYFTARSMSTGHPLTTEELQKLVDSKPAEIADLFRQSVPDGTNEKTSATYTFPITLIVLIVIAVVLLLCLGIPTVHIARLHKSRKPSKRVFESLFTQTIIPNTDGEKPDEGNETPNPRFFEDEESQSVTLVNETEVTSGVDTQSCHKAGDNDDDVSENKATERPPDDDSGVPNDQENGQEDYEEIENSFDDGSSSPQTPRSSGYLTAILDEPLLNSADPRHDAVDVTSPTTDSDALEVFLLPMDTFEINLPLNPGVDFEVQDNYLTEEEIPKEVTEAALPIGQAEVGRDLDPMTFNDEVDETGSLDCFLDFPTKSCTPPLVCKSQEENEEEEPMPEELRQESSL